MTEPQSAEQRNHWIHTIDSALIVIFLTATSYAVAFGYQDGYLSYFDMPANFVEVNVSGVVVAAATVAGAVLGMFVFVSGVLKMLPDSMRAWHPAVRRRLVSLGILWVVMFTSALYLDLRRYEFLLVVGMPSVLLAGELLMPLITHRTLPSYKAKIEASIRADIKNGAGPDVDFARTVIAVATPTGAMLVFSAVMVSLFSYSVGVRQARVQSMFLVPDSDSSCVTIAALSYGLLCVGVDLQTQTAKHAYQFTKPESTTLRLRKIGPLKKAEPESDSFASDELRSRGPLR